MLAPVLVPLTIALTHFGATGVADNAAHIETQPELDEAAGGDDLGQVEEVEEVEELADDSGESKDAAAPEEPTEEPETEGPEEEKGSASGLTYAKRVADSPWNRKGFSITFAPILSACFTDVCQEGTFIGGSDFKTAAGMIFELGYRPMPYFDIMTGLTARYQWVEGPDRSDVGSASYAWNIGVNGYPLAFSRFDPYIGFAFGYSQLWQWEDALTDTTVKVSQPNFRWSLGLDVYVTKRFALGIRQDHNAPFGGEGCSEVDAPGVPEIETCGTDGQSEWPRYWDWGLAIKGRI